jgi:hypothetical protein
MDNKIYLLGEYSKLTALTGKKLILAILYVNY